MIALTAPAGRAAKTWLVLATSLLLLLTLLTPPPASAADGSARGDLSPDDLQAADVDLAASPTAAIGDLGRGVEARRYLIRLHDPAIPSYRGGVEGFEATAPEGGERLNADSAPVRRYRDHLVAEQASLVARMDSAVGRDVEVPFTYQYAVNGMAAVLTPAEARQIAADPAVAYISQDFERELQTDAGPQWIGADEVWAEGEAPTGNEPCVGACGEGIVIGTIDTGISPSNPSFADVGGDGYDHTNPLGADNYLGVCDEDNIEQWDPDFPCNDKLIGAYAFVDNYASAVDYNGHGSHTASTSGGNVVNDVQVTTVADPPFTTQPFDIAGVAPHANIISYLGCCSLSGLTASIEQAIEDQVDVINYSIGSNAPTPDMWNDFDTLGYLNARAAGIIVATSNGNAGPGFATTGSPSDAPWIISVGASTHNRHNGNALIDLTRDGGGGLPNIEGKSVTESLGQTELVYAGDHGDRLCEDSSGNEAAFAGAIVVCDRGAIGRVLKSQNVAAQGAAGFVLIQSEVDGDSLLGDEYAIPGVFITYEDGQDLLDWMEVGTGHTAAIRGTEFVVDDVYGDVMASFSSRGPNRAVDVIVPSVTAPGVDVLAALGDGGNTGDPDEVDYLDVQHGFISGTSMASPHTAGAAALIRQERPDWTPAQVQSALMTTAYAGVRNHDGTLATPYAQGSGRIDVPAAIVAGLLFDESFTDYMDSNPAEGGDPKTLNVPSFANSQCLVECSWQRTATVPDTVSDDVTWTVSDTVSDDILDLTVELSDDTVSPGDTIDITVTADVGGAPEGVTLFGRITLTPDDPSVPSVTMPLAVVPSSGVLPDSIDVDTRRDAGSQLVEGLEAIEITDFSASVSGLVEADQMAVELDQDSTNGDPYDNLDGVFTTTVEVGADARLLIAEILESEAPDLDLFVGTGDTPSLATEECRSTTGTSAERCDIPDPAAGTWWVLVQNWGASDTPPDALTLATAVVQYADLGNATAEGPATNALGEPFDIRFIWDLDDAEEGDRFYGVLDLSSGAGGDGDIGSIPVTLDRLADDVTKTVDVAEAEPGDTVTYTVEVQPNATPEDLAYAITDAIPDGMTYVEGSLTGEDASHTDGIITWNPTMATPVGAIGDYVASTPATDDQCAAWSGFLDLANVANSTLPLDGDTAAIGLFSGIGPFVQYGSSYPNLIGAEDGLVTVADGYGGEPWVPQVLPTAAPPNGVFAPLWSDLELSVDDGRLMRAAQHSGLGAGIVQWDDPFEYRGDGTAGPSVGTFQAWIYNSIEDFRPEATFEYETLGALPGVATIGIEDFLGERATAIVNAGEPDAALTEGGTICLDYEGPTFDPATITYQATVDADAETGIYTNNAVHITSDPYAQPETASADVAVTGDGDTPGGVPAVSVTATDDSFVFARTGGTTTDLTVVYDVDGSAEPGEDYTELPGTVTISEGRSRAVVDVEFLDGTTDGATIVATVVDGDSYDVGTPASATITIDAGDTTPPDETEVLEGPTRIQTAIAISQASFPEDGSADAVILARSDIPFDALAGTPLAPDKNAPLLLTQSDELHPDTAAEISRVMAEDGIVYVLGGTAAIEDDVIDSLTDDGHEWDRIFGPTRYETALAVANEIGEPDAILVASGELFPDALSAGAAADEAGGIVLLTPDDAPHDVVTTYVAARPDTPVYAIGGPAAGVFPDAQPIVGTGREATAVLVADEFFDAPTMVGLARGDEFADALTGGAHAALQGGPVLLTPSDLLHPEVVPYLCANSDTLNRGFVYGGEAAINTSVVDDFTARMNGEGCAAG